jgi:hypothetical protein
MNIEVRSTTEHLPLRASNEQIRNAGIELVDPIRLLQVARHLRGVLNWMWLPLLVALAPQAKANLITNGSFASVSPAVPANGICTTNPTVYPSVDPGAYPLCSASGWSGNYQIANGSSIGAFGVSFGIPQPYPGGVSNALILQAELDLPPTATQSLNLPTAGLYTLSFYVANRSSPAIDDGPQTVSVLLDGTAIAGGTYGDLSAAWALETLTFSAAAGTHSLTLEGLDETTGATAANVAAFLDDVSLTPSVPEPSALSLLGLAFITLAMALRVTRKRLRA